MDSCQFVEYLFKIKIYIFQFLTKILTKNLSFVYFYKIITFQDVKRIYNPIHIQHVTPTLNLFN